MNSDKQERTGYNDMEVLPPVVDPVVSHDPYHALRFGAFRLLFLGTFIAAIGEQMVNVAIGWELYNRTGSSLALGLVGLVQVIPTLLLSLPAGYLADRFDRKRIVLVTLLVIMLSSLGLTVLSFLHGSVLLIYGCLLLFGTGVAFNNPASSALLPQTVPEIAYSSAATWSSSSWQLASVVGPALGGLVIALSGSATPVYALNAGAVLIFTFLIALIQLSPRKVPVATSRGTRLAVGGCELCTSYSSHSGGDLARSVCCFAWRRNHTFAGFR